MEENNAEISAGQRKLRPLWMRTLFLWWKRYAFISLGFLVWLSLRWTGILSEDIYNSGVYILGVLLFFLAIPISLIFRLDRLATHLGAQSSMILLLVALLFVGANFSALGLIQGFFRQRKRNHETPKSERQDPKPAKTPSLNGKTN